MINAVIGKQLMISVHNKVGALAEACGIVADAGINLIAICGYVIDDKGFIVFVTEDNAKAQKTLKLKDYDLREEEVIIVSLDNRPGTLKSVTEKIAHVGVDITLLYGSVEQKGKTSKIVIVTENNTVAMAALQ